MAIFLYVNLLKILPSMGSLNISCTIQLKNSQHWTFWEILLFAWPILDSYCLWCPHAMSSFNFLVFSQSSNFKFVIRFRKGHQLWIVPKYSSFYLYSTHALPVSEICSVLVQREEGAKSKYKYLKSFFGILLSVIPRIHIKLNFIW